MKAAEAENPSSSGSTSVDPSEKTTGELKPKPQTDATPATLPGTPNHAARLQGSRELLLVGRPNSNHSPAPQPPLPDGTTTSPSGDIASRRQAGPERTPKDDSPTSTRTSSESFALAKGPSLPAHDQSLEEELKDLQQQVDADANDLKDLEEDFKADLERVSKGLDVDYAKEALEGQADPEIDMDIPITTHEEQSDEQLASESLTENNDVEREGSESTTDYRRRTLPKPAIKKSAREADQVDPTEKIKTRRSKQFYDLSELSSSGMNSGVPPARQSEITVETSNVTLKKTPSKRRSALRPAVRFDSSVQGGDDNDKSYSEYEEDLTETLVAELETVTNKRLAPAPPGEKRSRYRSRRRGSQRSLTSHDSHTDAQAPRRNVPDRKQLLLATRAPKEEKSDESDLDSEERFEAEYHRRSVEMCMSCCCLCLVIVAFNGLGVLLTRAWINSDDDDTLEPSPAPSPIPVNGPSLAPFQSFEPLELVTLPDFTLKAIEQNYGSPQNRAYLWLQDDPLLGDYSEARLLQRFALATLYYATFGEGWTINTNWLSYETHECDWYSNRVSEGDEFFSSCGGNEQYRSLFLAQNGLFGSLPPELALLDSLQFIDVSTNAIGGTIPSQIGFLLNLKELLVGDNEISGTVPAEIGQLNRLQTLVVHSNPLTGTIPTELGLLAILKTLEWSQTKTGGTLPTELGLLRTMNRLDLGSNLLEGTIPSAIFLMTNLRDALVLNRNRLVGTVPTHIGQMTHASKIYLSHNDLHGTIPSEVGLLSNNTVFALDYNNLKGTIPSEIGRLAPLEWLNLCCNSLSGQLPSEVGLLTDLTFLDVEINRLSKSIPVEVAKNLDKLTILSMNANQFTGTIPSEVGLMTSLMILYLDRNRLTGTLPSEVGLLPNVDEFWVDYNSLTGLLPAELADMTSLEILRLSFNHFSGQIPEEIGSLGETLEGLGLETTLLSGVLPFGLCGIQQLNVTCSNTLCGCYCLCLGL